MGNNDEAFPTGSENEVVAVVSPKIIECEERRAGSPKLVTVESNLKVGEPVEKMLPSEQNDVVVSQSSSGNDVVNDDDMERKEDEGKDEDDDEDNDNDDGDEQDEPGGDVEDDAEGTDTSDSDSDSEALLDDLIAFHASENIESQSEAGKELRALLRRIGPDEFLAQTIDTNNYSARWLVRNVFNVPIPDLFGEDADDSAFYPLLGRLISNEINSRHKLLEYNTIDDAVELIRKSSNIMIITGAGISTSLGVPDFRSKNTGFYAQLQQEGFSDPEAVFDLLLFDEDPTIFYRYAGQTLPDSNKTTPTHAFIRLIQDHGKLLTNYTQNIDNIEQNAGIDSTKLIQCHGSWATFTCRKCGTKEPGAQFHGDVKDKKVIRCPNCVATSERSLPNQRKRKRGEDSHSLSRARNRNGWHDDTSASDESDSIANGREPGVMKPDITFFHEKLSDNFFDRFKQHDRDTADLVIVIGTSLTVSPVCEVPNAMPRDIPHIYISKDMVRHIEFDISLLGACDVVTAALADRLGWPLNHHMLPPHDRRAVAAEPVDIEKGIWSVLPEHELKVQEMPSETT